MFKITIFLCLVAVAFAKPGGLGLDLSLGLTRGLPLATAPVVTSYGAPLIKSYSSPIVRSFDVAPAIRTIDTPLIKTYSAPVVKTFATPAISYAAPAISYAAAPRLAVAPWETRLVRDW